MQELIEFMRLAESLSNEQHNSFLAQLDRQFIVSLLFNQLHLNLHKTNDATQIEKLNTTLKQIIDNNIDDEDEDDKEDKPILQIDKMPFTMINTICSFLELKSYIHFELCNRTIFVAARSPSQITEMQCRNFCTYFKYISSQNRYNDKMRFSRLKSAEFWDQHELMTLNKMNIKCDYLQQITLSERREESIEELVKCKNINLLNLTHFQSYVPNICMLLPHIPNLQYLEFVECDNIFIDLNDKRFIPKLKGFAITECSRTQSTFDIVNNLCKCTQLESFHTDENLNTFDQISFHNLKELCLLIHERAAINNNFQQLTQIIKPCQKLERIRIDTEDDVTEVSMQPMLKFMNVLFSLEQLECVSFSFLGNLNILLKLIQNALFVCKKNSIKIIINYLYDHTTVEEINVDLLSFINNLYMNVAKDFMFIFVNLRDSDLEGCVFVNSVKPWLGGLDTQKFCVYQEFDDGNKYFVVTNKGCKFNGYKEKWIMKCSHDYNYCY